MSLYFARSFNRGRIARGHASMTLIVSVGLGLTGLLLWLACWNLGQFPQNPLPIGSILLAGVLGTALMARYLRGLYAQLARAEARARESELKFHRLLQDMPSIAVQGYDQNRKVIF